MFKYIRFQLYIFFKKLMDIMNVSPQMNASRGLYTELLLCRRPDVSEGHVSRLSQDFYIFDPLQTEKLLIIL